MPNGGAARGIPYTAEQIAKEAGWAARKTAQVLQGLEMIEAGLLKESDLKGLGKKQAVAVVTECSEELRRWKRYEKEQAKIAEVRGSEKAKLEASKAKQVAKSEAGRVARSVANRCARVR